MSASMFILQSAATGNGNGTSAATDGFNTAQIVEIVESAGGTATVTLEGSFGGAAADTWYALGYQQTDATASLTRAASGISVGASSKHVYQLLDPYPQVRARISSISGATVTVRLFAVP